MVLIPMQDTGQRYLIHQLLYRGRYTRSAHPYRLGRIAYAQHGNALPGNERTPSERLQRIRLSIVFSNHAQTRRTAIHCIQLSIKRKTLHNLKPHSMCVYLFHSLLFISTEQITDGQGQKTVIFPTIQ
jgi:hypothetical protein